MTVGVGALSADSDGRETRAVVVCSDRMVTWGNTEFEHDIPKIIPITDRIVALMAGDAIRGSRIARESTNQVLAGTPSVLSVVQAVAHQYGALRRDQLQTDFFAPRGITYLTHDQLARVGELYADMYRPITDTLRKRLVGMKLLESGASELVQSE